MYYYEMDELNVIKYKFDLNINKLNFLKKQIIKDCGKIIHKSLETTNVLNYFNNRYVNNLEVHITEKKDDNNKNIYLVSYDLYNVPYLVSLIDRLLNKDISAINEIINYKESFSIENPEISEDYNILLDEINSKDNIKIYGIKENPNKKLKREKLLKKMEELLTDYELKTVNNYDNEKINKYRKLLLESINIRPIKTLNIKEFIEVQSFFLDSKQSELSNNLKKIIKI